MWLFNLNKVGGIMFGFTKRHEHEWRIRRLEENDETMLSTLNEIKLGQKTQEQVNIKLDKTLDAIQRERQIDEKNKKENDKNIRDMKMWILGLVGTIFSTIVIALIRTIFGI
ncbi:phage protein [Staphylococcus aureus SJUD6107]|nr:phage protein [Staphylococcus aureus SJUD6107]